MSWRTPLKHEVRTRDGKRLRTLADVRAYVLKLDERVGRQYWIHALTLLFEAAENGDATELRRQLRLALLHDGALDLTTEVG